MISQACLNGGNAVTIRQFQIEYATKVGRNFCTLLPNHHRVLSAFRSGVIARLIDNIVASSSQSSLSAG